MKRKARLFGSALLTAIAVGGFFIIYKQAVPWKASPKAALELKNITAADFGIVQVSETEWQLSAAAIAKYPKQDIWQLVSMLERDFTPLYDAQDRLVGYRVGGIERVPLFKEMGLRNGDILRSFNGQPIQSLLDMALRFHGGSPNTIEVERRGQLITLRYRFV